MLSLQLVLIAPLILRHFDTTQTAAWYLFGSLNLFGTFVMQRMLLTFARTIAMCRGGYDWRKPSKTNDTGESNWEGINRLVPTMAGLQIGLAFANVAIACILGWIGLFPLLKGYPQAAKVWTAFGIYQLGSVITFYMSRYHAVLMGLNALAISNRWRFFTVGIGLVGVAVVLILGYGIVAATVVNQSIYLIGGFVARMSIPLVANGRVQNLEAVRFDLEIIKLTIGPIWKSLINQIATSGPLPVAGILIAQTGNASVAASFSFASRILIAIEQVAMTPFNSVQPLISQLMAKRERAQVHEILLRRAMLSFSLMIAAILICGVAMPWALPLLDSNTKAVPFVSWCLMGGGVLIIRVYLCMLAPHYSLNDIIFNRESILSVGLFVIILEVLYPVLELSSVGVAMSLSFVLIYRTEPLKAYFFKLRLGCKNIINR